MGTPFPNAPISLPMPGYAPGPVGPGGPGGPGPIPIRSASRHDQTACDGCGVRTFFRCFAFSFYFPLPSRNVLRRSSMMLFSASYVGTAGGGEPTLRRGAFSRSAALRWVLLGLVCPRGRLTSGGRWSDPIFLLPGPST